MRTFNSNRLALAWALLGLAMVASAVFVLVEGRGLSFNGDELYYYAHLTQQGYQPVEVRGLEYLLAPHNGHFVLLGRLVYEFLFAVAGVHYFYFRLAEMLGVLVAVGLFFRLASRRVDPLVALAPCLVLLFFGYAYETLLWPFNLHTVYALAFGLAAILALERDDRLGDALACALLVCSVDDGGGRPRLRRRGRGLGAAARGPLAAAVDRHRAGRALRDLVALGAQVRPAGGRPAQRPPDPRNGDQRPGRGGRLADRVEQDGRWRRAADDRRQPPGPRSSPAPRCSGSPCASGASRAGCRRRSGWRRRPSSPTG